MSKRARDVAPASTSSLSSAAPAPPPPLYAPVLALLYSGALARAHDGLEAEALAAPGSAGAAVREADQQRVAQRLRQLEMGKNTLGYARYRALVPRRARLPRHPHSPNPALAAPKKTWDEQLRRWRRLAHAQCDLGADARAVAAASAGGGGAGDDDVELLDVARHADGRVVAQSMPLPSARDVFQALYGASVGGGAGAEGPSTLMCEALSSTASGMRTRQLGPDDVLIDVFGGEDKGDPEWGAADEEGSEDRSEDGNGEEGSDDEEEGEEGGREAVAADRERRLDSLLAGLRSATPLAAARALTAGPFRSAAAVGALAVDEALAQQRLLLDATGGALVPVTKGGVGAGPHAAGAMVRGVRPTFPARTAVLAALRTSHVGAGVFKKAGDAWTCAGVPGAGAAAADSDASVAVRLGTVEELRVRHGAALLTTVGAAALALPPGALTF